MQRYPEDTTADIEDFRRSGWKIAIDSADRQEYSDVWQSLSAAAKTAVESGRKSEGKVLWLLADACSMMLTPSNFNEPFKPIMVILGKRSALPEDFQESDVTLLAQIYEEIDDVRLQARLADIVWLLGKPRDPKHALAAIDAYRKIPLDTETWVRDGQECWNRAISLTRMLREGAGERLKEMEEVILSAFEDAQTEDGFLALWLSELMETHRLGKDRSFDIAMKLEASARSFDTEGELHRARDFYAGSAKWFQKARDEAKAAELTVCVAESWVKAAQARVASEQPSHMVAASFYEKAIQTLRSIPRRERDTHRVDERIAELKRLLNEAGARALDEMSEITTPAIDISEIVENARNAVRGKTTIDAVAALANIHSGARSTKIRESSEKTLREHPLQALFSVTHMSRDGRVISQTPGMGFGEANSKENQIVIWSQMVKHYQMELGLTVQAMIMPALEILILEHRIRENDFTAIASRSPIVPQGRERLFGKALFAGYEKDFVGALHLLVPQIEHMVRWHLKAADVKTTTLDMDGIENESGLSKLMELPEAAQIFGEDLAFELKALFCDAFGPNLRNELAHGLLGYEECQSVYSVYAWWFCLRILFNTFWNSMRAVNTEQDND